jgi:hypothetical protein
MSDLKIQKQSTAAQSAVAPNAASEKAASGKNAAAASALSSEGIAAAKNVQEVKASAKAGSVNLSALLEDNTTSNVTVKAASTEGSKE